MNLLSRTKSSLPTLSVASLNQSNISLTSRHRPALAGGYVGVLSKASGVWSTDGDLVVGFSSPDSTDFVYIVASNASASKSFIGKFNEAFGTISWIQEVTDSTNGRMIPLRVALSGSALYVAGFTNNGPGGYQQACYRYYGAYGGGLTDNGVFPSGNSDTANSCRLLVGLGSQEFIMGFGTRYDTSTQGYELAKFNSSGTKTVSAGAFLDQTSGLKTVTGKALHYNSTANVVAFVSEAYSGNYITEVRSFNSALSTNWGRRLVGVGDVQGWGGATVADSSGNVYLFTNTLTVVGGKYVMNGYKWNTSGTLQSAKPMLSIGGVTAAADAAIDSSNNIYVVGTTAVSEVEAQFSDLTDSTGYQSIWIAKYNSSLQLQWLRYIGTGGGITRPKIKINSAGTFIYVMGHANNPSSFVHPIVCKIPTDGSGTSAFKFQVTSANTSHTPVYIGYGEITSYTASTHTDTDTTTNVTTSSTIAKSSLSNTDTMVFTGYSAATGAI